MMFNKGARFLAAGCLTVVLFATAPVLAEDNGFGIGNGGSPSISAPPPPPADSKAAPAASAAAKGGQQMLVPVVAVVDVDSVMGTSQAAKSVAAQRDKWQQTYQNELSGQQKTLNDTKQKLDAERQTMKPEEFQEKARAFEQSVGEFERKVLVRRRALEKSVAIAMGQVERAMYEATAQVAGVHGVNLVLPRSQVILFADNMNLSKEVADAMNRKLSKVEMPAPQLESDAPAGGDAKKN